MKKHILILGSSGFLGKLLYNMLKRKFNVDHTGLLKRKLNIKKISNLKKLIQKNKYDYLINCIALTNVDICENNKKEAFNLNVKLVKDILFLKESIGLKFKLIHFSTDQIYNASNFNYYNKEEDIFKKKINYYTSTKLESEQICLKKNSKSCLVLRINFIGISLSKKNSFTDWLVDNIKKNNKILLAKDSLITPLNVETIGKIIKRIIQEGKFRPGVFNLGSRGGYSKLAIGKFFIDKLNKKFKNYEIKKINEIVKVRRPQNMMMNSIKFSKKFKIKLPTLSHELKSLTKTYDYKNK